MLYICECGGKTFSLPSQGDVVGKIETAVTKTGYNLAMVARDYDVGYTELLEANPGVDPQHLRPGTVLVIPNQFVLPNAPRQGIVINLPEMRLYYYTGKGEVITHPMGIGREGENTPVSVMKVIEHIPNPTWTATDTMRKLRAQEGVILPKSVPPGPDNPLGQFAMRLSSPTYLIHGTNDPLGGIGRRSSSGCMRLYPEDIESLFHQVKNGTTVYIIDQPYKAGWLNDKLYIQSRTTLNENVLQGQDDINDIKRVVQQQINNKPVQINWNEVVEISTETQGVGVPQIIGRLA